ncbi:uncharacterized protein LOC126624354 [Malus sylvestris]|uniref:uncharacterized protein LOC126624354 n=1 Tax=Malus sylvestris TaxID=3752 RepID=UPI0021AC5AC6|nr:uncharacterized protein LOC126624354 [Malus sylvestris]
MASSSISGSAGVFKLIVSLKRFLGSSECFVGSFGRKNTEIGKFKVWPELSRRCPAKPRRVRCRASFRRVQRLSRLFPVNSRRFKGRDRNRRNQSGEPRKKTRVGARGPTLWAARGGASSLRTARG